MPKPKEKPPTSEELSPDEKELFKSQEEMEKERGPIFYLTKKEKTPDGKETEKKYVSIAGVELEINQSKKGASFKKEEFSDFSLDEKSMELLKAYAIGIKLNQPVLVEGVTDIGKSKAIEYLSFLTNNKVMRISFSGQTDVTEFIGKHVPNTDSAKKLFEKTLEKKEELSEQSRQIIKKAEEENRGLTKEESREIAELEGIKTEGINWVWQDGMVVKELNYDKGKGCWSYYDELGAAEPQILVKLNRVFEDYSRLELSENGGRIVEAGPNHRILASTNPPEYAGRMPFAPDFIRRFVYQKIEGLDSKTLKQRTAFIFREKTSELPRNIFHTAAENPIDFKENHAISRVIEEALTEFHIAAQKLVEGGLAKDQKQQFNFEFSDIKRVKEYMEKMQEPDIIETLKKAIEFYYAGKLKNEEKRASLMLVLGQTMRLLKTKESIDKIVKKEGAKPSKETEEKREGLPPGHFNVKFVKSDYRGKEIFIAHVPGKKLMVLDRKSALPEENVEYLVKLTKDANPKDPHKGVFFVEIIGKSERQELLEETSGEGLSFLSNYQMYKPDGAPLLTYEEIKAGIDSEKERIIIKDTAFDNLGRKLKGCVSVWIKEK